MIASRPSAFRNPPSTVASRCCVDCPSHLSGIFSGLSKEKLAVLEQHLATNRYLKGQAIFYEGNYPLGVYCIESGRVKLHKSSTSGRRQIMRIAGPGELLGYRSFLAGERYCATAEALEESRLCFIGKQAFLSFLTAHPVLALRLAEKACRDFGRVEQYFFDTVNKSVEARIAKLLLFLKESFGRPDVKGTRVHLELTRHEMAEWISATPETVIRVLSRFRKCGLVLLENRNLTILDADTLSSIGNSNR